MFKVYVEKKKEKEAVFFKLLEEEGCVVLRLVYESGENVPAANILSIDKEGLHLNASINRKYAPFPLTVEGQIERGGRIDEET